MQLALDALVLSQAAKLLRGVTVQRITFVEVTKAAVLAALAAPRAVAMPLVEAYLARHAIDYLLGFHLTPVLWRKLPAAKSAGAPLHSAKSGCGCGAAAAGRQKNGARCVCATKYVDNGRHFGHLQRRTTADLTQSLT